MLISHFLYIIIIINSMLLPATGSNGAITNGLKSLFSNASSSGPRLLFRPNMRIVHLRILQLILVLLHMLISQFLHTVMIIIIIMDHVRERLKQPKVLAKPRESVSASPSGIVGRLGKGASEPSAAGSGSRATRGAERQWAIQSACRGPHARAAT